MTDFLYDLKKIGDFLSKLTERNQIEIAETDQLKIFHHKIAEKTLLLLENQAVNDAENNPNILKLMTKIDNQLKILDPGEKSLKDLFSLLRQLNAELDNILKPFVKEVSSRKSELIKALCNMSGHFSGLATKEKDPAIRKGLLELLEMINDKLKSSLIYKELKEVNTNFNEVISRIKETGNLIKGYQQKSKTRGDLLEHVNKVCNEVECLFLGQCFHGPNQEQPINKSK